MTTLELLKTLLEESIEKFYKNDNTLIKRENKIVYMERSVVMRIYYYMRRMLDDDPRFQKLASYNLDGEYNKNGIDKKRIKDNSEKGGVPDIILHRRLFNTDNLLIVEFKVGNNTDPKNQKFENDIDKLNCATSQDSEFHFFLGVSVLLTPFEGHKRYLYFQDGKETPVCELKHEI